MHLIFEEGACDLYRACEWGQVRRTQDSGRGGMIVGKRAAVSTQAILVRPDSPINYPQKLAGKVVGVNFHAGSHYLALMFLEGFIHRDEIKVVHAGRPLERYEALMAGEVDAVGLMEPWIALAEKNGCKSIGEAHYTGSDIAAPDMDEARTPPSSARSAGGPPLQRRQAQVPPLPDRRDTRSPRPSRAWGLPPPPSSLREAGAVFRGRVPPHL